MKAQLYGYWSIALKEFLHLRRDPTTLVVALLIPVIQLTIFGFAIDFDVRHISTIVIDMDAGTTTVDAGDGTRTLRGVPKDRSIVEKGNRSAASLYVRGDISSLHGPGRNGGGQSIPALLPRSSIRRSLTISISGL